MPATSNTSSRAVQSVSPLEAIANWAKRGAFWAELQADHEAADMIRALGHRLGEGWKAHHEQT